MKPRLAKAQYKIIRTNGYYEIQTPSGAVIPSPQFSSNRDARKWVENYVPESTEKKV